MEGFEVRVLNTSGSHLQSHYPQFRHGSSWAEGSMCGARGLPHGPEVGRPQGLVNAEGSMRGPQSRPGLEICSSCRRHSRVAGRPEQKGTLSMVCRALIFLLEEPRKALTEPGRASLRTTRQAPLPGISAAGPGVRDPGPAGGRVGSSWVRRKAAGNRTRLSPPRQISEAANWQRRGSNRPELAAHTRRVEQARLAKTK